MTDHMRRIQIPAPYSCKGSGNFVGFLCGRGQFKNARQPGHNDISVPMVKAIQDHNLRLIRSDHEREAIQAKITKAKRAMVIGVLGIVVATLILAIDNYLYGYVVGGRSGTAGVIITIALSAALLGVFAVVLNIFILLKNWRIKAEHRQFLAKYDRPET
ncbi:MAG: hypothetical protein O2967_08850 [Proteobacteria bacterium]|nr:hypothetical protein [Pseudomonadota bacterium]